MASMTPRTIEWVDLAPVRIEARASSGAAPEAVFDVLDDHQRWPEWFPRIEKVTVLGPATGVGARRRVALRGASFDEEFIVWEPGVRWSFIGLASKPGFLRSLLEDCILTPLESGGTSISYTMYMDPLPALRPLVRAAAGVMRANNTKAMTNLARRAEG